MLKNMIFNSSYSISMKSLFKEGRHTKEKEEENETPRGFQGEESCSETYRRFQEGEEDPCTSYHNKEDELYRKNKSMAPPLGRMTEEEISLLLFQTMKGIEEDLKEIERVETCTITSTTLEEKPSCSVMEEYYTVAEEALASTSHQGIIKNPFVVISTHYMKR